MKIGELARLAGVNIQTVRYYERRHLLAEPRRTQSGYRDYSHHDLLRLRFILRAKVLGFTLTEIDELLALRVDPTRSADDVRVHAEEKIAATEAKIRDLKRIRAALQHLVGSCEAHGPVAQCALIHAIETVEEA
ncbi:MAG TPA: MerR family transcriptional regulator [Longimicrobiales bacterium]